MIRAYRVPKTQHSIGYRALSGWGVGGELLSPYAVGDVVYIPENSPGFVDGRIPHPWSSHPELSQRPGLYCVTTIISIGDGDEWYFRVSPVREQDGYVYDTSSDRLHIIPPHCDYTADWVLTFSTDPANTRRPIKSMWYLR